MKKSENPRIMPNPYLSIVIPAYNEANRLPQTLESFFSYLPTLGRPYEIIIVDDGSTDSTRSVVESLAKRCPELRIISYSPNQGRGVAVRKGVLEARGEIILETDADGSVADEAIGRFLRAFDADPKLQVIFGSREMRGARIAQKQPFLRVVLGYGFIYLTKVLFLMWDVTDFTLGFKMFRREAAIDIFSHQYNPHYFAEAELVYVSHKRGWRSIELPVTWTDNKDSRISPLKEVFRSLAGILGLLARSFSGKYR